MLVQICSWIRNPIHKTPFSSIVNTILHQRPKLSQTLVLKMSAEPTSKRLVCPTCSKPARLCLCNRFRNPALENSVRVTILQHGLEKNHPLNSARIATLGLKNVVVVNVTDVHFEARFDIWLLDSDMEMGSADNEFGCCSLSVCENAPESSNFNLGVENVNGFDSDGGVVKHLGFEQFLECPGEIKCKLIDNNEECSLGNEQDGVPNFQNHCEKRGFVQNLGLDTTNILQPRHQPIAEERIDSEGTFGLETPPNGLDKQAVLDTVLAHNAEVINGDGADQEGSEVPAVTATIGKYGFDFSLNHYWVPQIQRQKHDVDQLLDLPEAVDSFAKGFVVKKLQKRQLNGIMELEEYEEFELEVPPGSVLLFPTDEAIGVEGLEAANFEVKNLIVLDGTWAKAKRMYNENPWLKLLPHLKLDLNKISMYSEVRQQPRAGYLSTIESIVYTLKALGDNPEELDNLLDVFESMVGDQRRCKNERLSKVSPV